MSSVRFFNFLSAAGFVLLVLLTAAPATPQQAPGTLEGVCHVGILREKTP